MVRAALDSLHSAVVRHNAVTMSVVGHTVLYSRARSARQSLKDSIMHLTPPICAASVAGAARVPAQNRSAAVATNEVSCILKVERDGRGPRLGDWYLVKSWEPTSGVDGGLYTHLCGPSVTPVRVALTTVPYPRLAPRISR